MKSPTIPVQSKTHTFLVLLMILFAGCVLLVSPVAADEDKKPVISFTSVNADRTEVDINGENLHNGTDFPTVILGLNGEDGTMTDYILPVISIGTLLSGHDQVIARLVDRAGNPLPLIDGTYLTTVFPTSAKEKYKKKNRKKSKKKSRKKNHKEYEDGVEFHLVVGGQSTAGPQGEQGSPGNDGEDGNVGAPGPGGEQGPPGPQTMAGLLTGRISNQVPTTFGPGGVQIVLTSCPATHPIIISGGCSMSAFFGSSINITGNTPSPSSSSGTPDEYFCTFRNVSTEVISTVLNSFAICAK